jgi:hypothetical protein
MEDLLAKLEKLLLEAEDCELIAKLATDIKKRAFFAKLAIQLKAMARDVDHVIALRATVNDNNAASQGAIADAMLDCATRH